MAKGYDQNRERLALLSEFGKPLARRSGSKCELCGGSGVGLAIFEVPPVPAEPVLETCIFICGDCSGQIRKPKTINGNHWYGLRDAVWNETPAVQVMAIRVLRHLHQQDIAWVDDVLEGVFPDPECEEWVSKATLDE